LGTIPLAIQTDTSNNVGIGGAANASFKLQVTGATNLTGALSGTSATFSGGVTLATSSGVLAINTTGRPAGVGGGDNGKIWSKQATSGNPNGNYGIATIASATDSFTYIGHNGTDALLGTSYGTTGAYTDLVIQTADVTRFRLSGSTGAATFSSSVTADYLTSNGGGQINTTVSPLVLFNSSGGGNAKRFGLNMTNLDGFKIYSLNDNGTTRKDNIIFANIDGNVGIGTSSPNYLLSVVKDGSGNANTGIAGSQLVLSRTTGHTENIAFRNTGASNGISGTNYAGQIIANGCNVLEMYTNGAVPLVLGTNDTERMRITSGGAICVNRTDAPYGNFVIKSNSTTSYAGLNVYANGSERFIAINHTGTFGIIETEFGVGGSHTPLAFVTGGSQRMTIGTAGLVTITSLVSTYTTAAAANMYADPSNGAISRSTSSIKYKNSVTNYDKGLDIVNQLRPVYYKGNNDGDTIFAGLIAEEVHDLGLTEFVQYLDGSPDSLAYSNMIALAFKAIQEQQAQIEELRQIVATK
jgi:hypothetical protein